MTSKKNGAAVQGASTPTKTDTKKATPSKDVKPINDKVEEFKKLQAYFDDLAANVKARETLLNHKSKIESCVKSPDLVNQLDGEIDPSQADVVAIELKTGEGYREKYTISNPQLMRDVLLFIDSKLSEKLEEVEINLQHAAI